jgi:hypothetical protein
MSSHEFGRVEAMQGRRVKVVSSSRDLHMMFIIFVLK